MAQQRIQLRPGDPAPVVDVTGPDGPVSIAMAWADGPMVLTFLRHFG